MTVKCANCSETLLKRGEKFYGLHFTDYDCCYAIIRSIDRTLARSDTALRHLQRARQLLEEAASMTIDFSWLHPACEDGPCDHAATTHYTHHGKERHVCAWHRTIYLQEQAWRDEARKWVRR